MEKDYSKAFQNEQFFQIYISDNISPKFWIKNNNSAHYKIAKISKYNLNTMF